MDPSTTTDTVKHTRQPCTPEDTVRALGNRFRDAFDSMQVQDDGVGSSPPTTSTLGLWTIIKATRQRYQPETFKPPLTVRPVDTLEPLMVHDRFQQWMDDLDTFALLQTRVGSPNRSLVDRTRLALKQILPLTVHIELNGLTYEDLEPIRTLLRSGMTYAVPPNEPPLTAEIIHCLITVYQLVDRSENPAGKLLRMGVEDLTMAVLHPYSHYYASYKAYNESPWRQAYMLRSNLIGNKRPGSRSSGPNSPLSQSSSKPATPRTSPNTQIGNISNPSLPFIHSLPSGHVLPGHGPGTSSTPAGPSALGLTLNTTGLSPNR
ncbi:hypothetical protein M231_05052 [Tremella mesenterica]|uniref:Uncharacterized protein n=1 Tax=Tremella mesenterica TaxID=5217 RepID=A0A4Q1BJ25_TREME|nr:hypothetical protein M231_05052 [Tremella mesenterica]